MSSYSFSKIEPKWQKYWEDNNIYKVAEEPGKKKYFVLDMFPYPSGAGLHIGHPEGYTASDIVSRFKRMKGFNVLHPMGFDAFGLPTERYCMMKGIHPNDATCYNIDNFTKQLKMLGLGYDWSRVINTTDPEYYKWTQWMFLMIYNSWFDEEQQKARHIDELPIPEDITDTNKIESYKDKHRLAYIDMIPVNWCEKLGTVLANEECDEWREKGYEVEKRPMKQWMIRITKYAKRLLEDLDLVDWPTSTMDMQKHWIGKSNGAEILFPVKGTDKNITVFTTRPDTIFGATYMVLAPELPIVKEITSSEKLNEVEEYKHQAALKTDLERTELAKEKTGVFTGAYAVNPATGEDIPIWIADYVMVHYGTGAIMAVPGHDERDHEFATKFKLDIKKVVEPADGSDWDIISAAYVEKGKAVNSENAEFSINGLKTKDAIRKTISWLMDKAIGKAKTQYKLHDWLFSRQRYWGEPIPIMFFDDGSKRCLELDELPLKLPEIKEFKPTGTTESPLSLVKDWVDFVDEKTGKHAAFETNTMPQWAGSCWYYLRYMDPHNDEMFCDSEKEKYWMQPDGVDLYVGGAEHAVLHLLYARFWHKVLYDHGYVTTKEPFKKLFHQGLILGEDGKKMSKSMGNVINPEVVVDKYGADSLRMFEMFIGPLQDAKPWSDAGIEGVNRFLNRVWRLMIDDEGKLSKDVQDVPMTKEQEYHLHSTIKKIADDIENLHFNTSVSQMMIFVNEFNKQKIKPIEAMEKFVLILSPFAPHIAEELWQRLGYDESVVLQKYPDYDEKKTQKQEIEFVFQVSSKIRSKQQLAPGLSQDEIADIAQKDEKVQKWLEGKTVRKVIFVPDKLINFIVG